MKKVLIIMICFIMCGCSTVYNLEINGDNFYENIEIEYLKSENQIGTELYEKINNIKDAGVSPFNDSSSNEKYDISTTQTNTKEKVNLTYSFDKQSYQNSSLFNTCFENNDSIFDNKYFIISLNGHYTCNYWSDFVVKIKTNHKVIKHNANKKQGKNTYVWNVSRKDPNDIYIKMNSKVTTNYWLMVIGGVTALLIVLLFIFIIVKKIKNKNAV